ncbi:hypothetical protein [Propioniciclava flava]
MPTVLSVLDEVGVHPGVGLTAENVDGELKLTIEGHESFVTPDVAHHLLRDSPGRGVGVPRTTMKRGFDWEAYLDRVHRDRPALSEAVAAAAQSGGASPHHWLAPAVSPRAATVLNVLRHGGNVA